MKFAKFVLKALFLLHSTAWVLFCFLKFKKQLNLCFNIEKIKLLNFAEWHFGNFYLTGYIGQRKVFIKTDFLLGLIKNELEAYKLLSQSASFAKYKLPLVGSGENYIVYEFLEGLTLEAFLVNSRFNNNSIPNEILFQLTEILDLMSNSNIIHRDFTARNVMVKNSHNLIPIDFYYSVSNKTNSKLRNLDSNFLTENIIFRKLGIQKSTLLWDDAYSIIESLKASKLHMDSQLLEKLENRVGRLEFGN